VFREFHRVLKPEGVLVFSTHHPFMDWIYHKTGNYFTREIVEDEWEKIGKIKFYRRPLTLISQDLAAAGFVIERLLEPQPTEMFRQKSPAMYEKLTKNPQFLFIRARKG
jgi:ubiquinone/menaquinone biosynthesis C-methylase UbiE